MAKTGRSFAGAMDRMKQKEAESHKEFPLLEEDTYLAVCVGVAFTEDVEGEFDGKKRLQDKIRYIFLAQQEDESWFPIKADYNASINEKATLPPLLGKVGLTMENFYELLGMTVRLSVSQKANKEGTRTYNKIDKFMAIRPKDDELTVDSFELQPFFVDGLGTLELLDTVTVKQKDAPKPTNKRMPKVKADIDIDDIPEDLPIPDPKVRKRKDPLADMYEDDDSFFDDLEDDDDE